MTTIPTIRKILLISALAAASFATPARAGDFELTLLGGVRIGNLESSATSGEEWLRENSTFGLALGWPEQADKTLELVFTHQETALDEPEGDGSVGIDLHTVGLGGTYSNLEHKGWRPFVSGTGGLTLATPEVSGYDTNLYATLTVGAGVFVPVSKKAGFRFEGRGLLAVAFDGSGAICGDGACLVGLSGSGFGQFEVLAGFTWSP